MAGTAFLISVAFQPQPVFGNIEHSAGVAPLVIKPDHQFKKSLVTDPGLGSVDNRRA